MSVEFVFWFSFCLMNRLKAAGGMKGTVDRSINKHLCYHLNLQMKSKNKHYKCSLLELMMKMVLVSGE